MEQRTGQGILITSDLHVRGQFERGIAELQARFGERLLPFDFYIAGDVGMFTEDGWHEDPGYTAKKKVRAETGDEALARKVQDEAWETQRDEMVTFGLRSHRLSQELMESIDQCFSDQVLGPIMKIWGNSTVIVANDQRKALDLAGRGDEPTLMDMLAERRHIWPANSLTCEQYGERMVVTIPYTEDRTAQAYAIAGAKTLPTDGDIKEVLFVYHENRFPGLLDVKAPVVTQATTDAVFDILRHKFPKAQIYEVAGHNHVIPDEPMIRTEAGSLLVPVGIDKETLVGATLIAEPNRPLERISYEVVR